MPVKAGETTIVSSSDGSAVFAHTYVHHLKLGLIHFYYQKHFLFILLNMEYIMHTPRDESATYDDELIA